MSKSYFGEHWEIEWNVEDSLEELDKSIEDVENGRVTQHEETMKNLIQRYYDYVSQNDH